MKAFLKNYHQTPRKVRMVADLLRGKRVSEALQILQFLPKRAAGPLAKLIKSAFANAKALGKNEINLHIKDIRVDKGIVMHRFMPRARGSSAPIKKRLSHVKVLLGEQNQKSGIKNEKK